MKKMMRKVSRLLRDCGTFTIRAGYGYFSMDSGNHEPPNSNGIDGEEPPTRERENEFFDRYASLNECQQTQLFELLDDMLSETASQQEPEQTNAQDEDDGNIAEWLDEQARRNIIEETP